MGSTGVPAYYTWEEVQRRSTREERWLVINRKVYDITRFCRIHPGGPRVISHYAGQDATAAMVEDFRALRSNVEKMGLLKPNKLFFFGALVHILLLDVVAYSTLYYFGTSLIPFLITTLLLGTVQGAPASWWNHMHFQHHAKPNCYRKDPDINMHPLFFALGKKLSVELGEKKKKYMPYNHQHKYFFLIGPPALIPVYFQWYIFYFAVHRKQWVDLAWIISFYVRFALCYIPLLGIGGTITMFFLVRFVESNWFVWVTQMNHIPMNIDYDQNKEWLSTQLQATCNVDQSLFNDWFSGHLNFQIEHHLFPTMPRHNYWKVAPLVRSLCKKYDVDYQSKPLFTAFADIVDSLRESGELWLDAYLHK